MEKSRGFLSRSLFSRLMVSGEERKIGRRESGRTSEREGEGNCLNHGLNGLRRFHGLNDVFDGRDSEKISIALIIHSLDLLPRRVCGEDRRMAAGFGNRAGAVLGVEGCKRATSENARSVKREYRCLIQERWWLR